MDKQWEIFIPVYVREVIEWEKLVIGLQAIKLRIEVSSKDYV